MKNKRPLELYVHIPFCARKCGYCDFLSAPAKDPVQMAYAQKLIEEIVTVSAAYEEYEVSSIFIGGGTPSILPGEWIKEIMKAIGGQFAVREDAEITIEVNPGTVTMEKLEHYRDSRINRISIGLQSGEDQELKEIGRIHTYDDFLKTFQQVRMAGFTNVSIDLMSALPGQTMETWEKTLKKVVMLRPEHISAYSLIIEENTPFFDRYGEDSSGNGEYPPLPDEDTERQMYWFTQEYLQKHGYVHYEISNYGRPGFSCRHNLGYWNGTEYLGLGLGASSYVNHHRFHNEADLDRYLELDFQKAWENGLYQDIEHLSPEARMEEFMFLGLRMMEGVSGSDFVKLFGQNMWNIYGDVIEKLEKEGLIKVRQPRIWLTERGIDVSNYVMAQFLLTV